MQKQTTNKTNKEDVSGSETIFEKIKNKTPWIFGKTLKKPKILFPRMNRGKMDIPLPGKSIAVIAVYVILFILQTGIVYLIYRDPPAIGANPSTGDPLFLYPDINESFIIEGIVASIFIFLCSTGFVMLYQASKYVYNKTIAVRILVVGIILILAAFGALQAMTSIKLGERLFNI
jgi:hypothetical protein